MTHRFWGEAAEIAASSPLPRSRIRLPYAVPHPIRRPPAGHDPPNDAPAYRSTALRHPVCPLVAIPQTLSETTGPVYGHGPVGPLDGDLTRQHPS